MRKNLVYIPIFIIPLFLFGIILSFKIPDLVSKYIAAYSFLSFCLILTTSYFSFRLLGKYGLLIGLSLTAALFAVALSYKWTSGYSDNFLIGGLIPYKDGKNYYIGAHLILDGLPLESGQATQRPLFPGLLSSLLFVTGQNLKLTQAFLTAFLGAMLYYLSRVINKQFGPLSASIFFTLLFFYVHRFIGYTLSEVAGLIIGCLAFLLLWQAASSLKWFDLILGLCALMVAISARAGAFFIFPFLVFGIGWLFKGEKKFSYLAAAISLGVIGLAYYVANVLYPAWVGVPKGSTFSNFAYALYGQVQGGVGWHKAIDDFGNAASSIIYKATFQNFWDHPFSFFIAAAKSYRDVFSPGHHSFFQFNRIGRANAFDFIIWAAGTALTIWGLIKLARKHRSNLAVLFLAGFLGIFVSIPFLPPIDGGVRFYASTMPFFYIIPALAVQKNDQIFESDTKIFEKLEIYISRFATLTVLFLTMIIPTVNHALGSPPVVSVPQCPNGQIPFAIETDPGSYIDIISNRQEECGLVPEICLHVFEQNAVEKSSDTFYKVLVDQTQAEQIGLRLTPATNLVGGTFHYFLQSLDMQPDIPVGQIISGCASEIDVGIQSFYRIESLSPTVK